MANVSTKPAEKMPFSDRVFYVVSGAFLVTLATGLWLVFIDVKLEKGIPLSLLSVVGLAATLIERDRLKAIDRPLAYALIVVFVSMSSAAICGYDIYDRHYHRSTGSVDCPDCNAWDDNAPLERVYGAQRPFTDETVKLDGRHFINPVFDSVTFEYEGTGGVQMDNPQFVKHQGGVMARIISHNKVVTQTIIIMQGLEVASGCTNFGVINLGPVPPPK